MMASSLSVATRRCWLWRAGVITSVRCGMNIHSATAMQEVFSRSLSGCQLTHVISWPSAGHRPRTDRTAGRLVAARRAVLSAEVDDLEVEGVPAVLREHGAQIAFGLDD